MTRRLRPAASLAVLAAVGLLAGCEAIFTFSPVAALQRAPSSLTPEGRITYGQDALASGDKAAMADAWEALKNDTSTDALYTTAQLGIELSGVPGLLLEVVSDPAALTTSNISAFIADHGLDPSFLVDAAARLTAVDADVELTPTDYAMGALGILLGGTGGTWDVSTASASSVTDATAFFGNAVSGAASLDPTDPLRMFVDSFNSYLTGL
jgi:hypothetical protein